MWPLINSANFAIPEMEMVSKAGRVIKEANRKLKGRAAVSVHPSLYRKLKLIYPNQVGGIISRRQLTDEEAKGNLGQVFEIPTREEFGLCADP